LGSGFLGFLIEECRQNACFVIFAIKDERKNNSAGKDAAL
jgi:hypothetical protein